MNSIIILPVVFLAAAAALFSGFGVGTILTPVFLIFYEVKTAIFLVAVVHLLNNLLKLSLFYKHIDFAVLKRFGIMALIGSFIGSFSQIYLASAVLKKLVALVLIYLGLQPFFPSQLQFRLPKKIDAIGGFFSGLLGGLVGNQGAIRSAFLLNYKMSKETFIATGVVIACLIDLIRIPVYWFSQKDIYASASLSILWIILVTFSGTWAGSYLLKFFSPSHFKKFVSFMILALAICLLI